MQYLTIDGLTTNTIFAALIASLLYTATYLSFVRLMRYPRNWHRPSLLGSIVTGGLAALSVGFVSFSPTGIDWAALAVSSCFIGTIFCLTAAPAIAFRPSSRVVEFIANHADYAGLVLSGTMLLAAAGLSNIKLIAVLATALAIETTWFVRQYQPSRQRKLYPLKGRDLSVLNNQAKGDIAAFRNRHGIRELVLSNGAVSWKGCGRQTPPCRFNFYVNRLGLNTAPCCREHMKELSNHIAAFLTEMGAVYWLEGGSLLGAVRERGALLDWEDDVDISVLIDDEMTWERLSAGLVDRCAQKGYYVDVFKKTGFISISFDTPKKWPFKWERHRLPGEIRADIAVYRRATSHGKAVLERRSHKGAMELTESGGYGVPLGMVLPTSTIGFLGGSFGCPSQSVSYLNELYGDFSKVEYTYVDAAAAQTRAAATHTPAAATHIPAAATLPPAAATHRPAAATLPPADVNQQPIDPTQQNTTPFS